MIIHYSKLLELIKKFLEMKIKSRELFAEHQLNFLTYNVFSKINRNFERTASNELILNNQDLKNIVKASNEIIINLINEKIKYIKSLKY